MSEVKTKQVGRPPMKSDLFHEDPEEQKAIMKATIARNGIQQKDIADQVGLDLSTVSGVINGHYRNEKVIRFIENLPHQVR